MLLSTMICTVSEPLTIRPAPSLQKSYPPLPGLTFVIVPAGCISMVELVVPWNSEDSLASAKRYKSTKDNYQLVLSDLAGRTIRAELITVEIGCLGHHTNDMFCALKHLAPHCSKSDRCELRDRLSQSVIAPSYTIFRGHRSPTWQL